jgi:hypothetical protein
LWLCSIHTWLAKPHWDHSRTSSSLFRQTLASTNKQFGRADRRQDVRIGAPKEPCRHLQRTITAAFYILAVVVIGRGRRLRSTAPFIHQLYRTQVRSGQVRFRSLSMLPAALPAMPAYPVPTVSGRIHPFVCLHVGGCPSGRAERIAQMLRQSSSLCPCSVLTRAATASSVADRAVVGLSAWPLLEKDTHHLLGRQENWAPC